MDTNNGGSGERVSTQLSTIQPQDGKRRQFSSFILFAAMIILLNLCPPFQQDFDYNQSSTQLPLKSITHQGSPLLAQHQHRNVIDCLESSIRFIKLMLTNPMRFEKRTTRFTLAEARMLGKMAKVWYIKKKIKKLSKKLKKHTIAVPVFTAIPIYEHSYYPQPHVTHVTHGGGLHHAAAASSYSPSVAQVTAGAPTPLAAAASSNQHQMIIASASNNHPTAYRLGPNSAGHHGHSHSSAVYHPQASNSHHIINAYTPSQPLFVDDAGGLYGHYGNAYGRYDGGYHVW